MSAQNNISADGPEVFAHARRLGAEGTVSKRLGSSYRSGPCDAWVKETLLFAASFLELTFNAMAQTLVQLNAHQEIRGRTLGLFNMASLGLRAFSGITVGLIGSMIGVHWSLAVLAMVLAAITCLLPWIGRKEGPGGADRSLFR